MAKAVYNFSRKEIWEIASLYATGPYGSGDFAEEYGISRATVYSIFRKAVVENIVDDKTVELMASRAANNSDNKVGRQGKLWSQKNYARLKIRRKEYMLSKRESIALTVKYAYSPLNKEEFAKENYITKALLDRTIYRTIVTNKVSELVFYKLQLKSFKRKSNDIELRNFWDSVELLRNENKKNQS